MKSITLIICTLGLIFNTTTILAQRPDSLPSYEQYMAKLDKNETDIDYKDFRISYLYSTPFKTKWSSNYDEQKQLVYKYIKKRKFQKIIAACNEMLKSDYTSMFAHKYLQQTYKILGDSGLYHKHHDIEFGLLRSIVKQGDGASCSTAWSVTQVEEEYFILRMIGAMLTKQSLVGSCDRMNVNVKGDKRTYWFNVYWVFKGRDELKSKK